MSKETAAIFNIQRFSVHDGPGIRTTVFLKGCNLTCQWCHNPESMEGRPQIQFFKEKCVQCGMCRQACCRQGAAPVDGKREHVDNCIVCGRCVEMCMHDALKLAGEQMTAEQVMAVVRRDKAYYDNTGGGMTLSGGEPLLQPKFCASVLRQAQKEGILTAVDTAAHYPYSVLQSVLPYTDAVLLDIKAMDNKIHKKYTGVENTRILENAKQLFKEKVDVYIRIPVVCGVNDTKENMQAINKFIRKANNIKEVRLLPYHNLGQDKAKSVEKEQRVFRAPTEAQLKQLVGEFDRPVIYE